MLHLLQVVLHHVQALNASLKIFRKVGEQRRDLGVFKVLKLRDDVITFLPRFYPVDKILGAITAQAEMVDALGKHSRKKQSVIADVFAHLSFAIKRRRGTVD